jgi:hypothetical protein
MKRKRFLKHRERPEEDEAMRELDEWLEAHRDELAAVDEKLRKAQKKEPLAVIL